MSNYIPHYQKKNRILRKRIREIRHALNTEVDQTRIAKAAEKVRAAKLGVIKAKHGGTPGGRANPAVIAENEEWSLMSVAEIITWCERR